MTASRNQAVYCDWPNCEEQFRVDKKTSTYELLEVAVEYGWSYTWTGRDDQVYSLCPRHT